MQSNETTTSAVGEGGTGKAAEEGMLKKVRPAQGRKHIDHFLDPSRHKEIF